MSNNDDGINKLLGMLAIPALGGAIVGYKIIGGLVGIILGAIVFSVLMMLVIG